MSNVVLSPERVREIAERRAALPDTPWELEMISDGKPRKSAGGSTFDPEYFKHDDEGKQIFCPAYDVVGLQTIGDYESGAMEKPQAEFVFHCFTDVPALTASHEALRERNLALEKRIAELKNAASDLLTAMETCHICSATLVVFDDREVTHCENCSFDCAEHDEPDCKPILTYQLRLQAALSEVREGEGKE